MQTADFDFDLPDDLIALHPSAERDRSRLLVVTPDMPPPLADRAFADLPDLLASGDVLVFNDTRVIPAALAGTRVRGEAVARVVVNLHKRVDACRWRAFVRPSRKLEIGERVSFGNSGSTACLMSQLDATVVEKAEGGEVTFAFDLAGPDLDAAIAAHGAMPLPPYIAARRPADATDRERYQTVYARSDGAVAAPTAGLHFTDRLFAQLAAQGIGRAFLTLHVGAGTFLPVKTDEIAGHRMHAEWGEVTAEVASQLNAVRRAGGRVIAVGTTVARLLESAVGEDGVIRPFTGETAIFMTPGFRFRAIDGLVTNFHLPRSTLFMLVSAFSGLATMQAAYAHAIAQRYRFYSYGDASLLWPERHD